MFLNTHLAPAEKYWYEGKLYDWTEAGLRPMIHALHYGTCVFEGIRAYKTYGVFSYAMSYASYRLVAALGVGKR